MYSLGYPWLKKVYNNIRITVINIVMRDKERGKKCFVSEGCRTNMSQQMVIYLVCIYQPLIYSSMIYQETTTRILKQVCVGWPSGFSKIKLCNHCLFTELSNIKGKSEKKTFVKYGLLRISFPFSFFVFNTVRTNYGTHVTIVIVLRHAVVFCFAHKYMDPTLICILSPQTLLFQTRVMNLS